VKSRECSPSPKMRGRWSASSDWMKRGMTAEYWDEGSWRGPKTLK